MFNCSRSFELEAGGFSFENTHRNAVLESSLSISDKVPTARKTGTTIAGVVYKDGVILGSDTRATDDMVVAVKDCVKIHCIAPKIYCCGAGVAADAHVTAQIMASNAELHTLNTGRPPLVAMVTRQLKQLLFRHHGHIGSSFIVGGVDGTGIHLFSIFPHGSYDKLPFLSLGSGAAAAISVFEDRFKANMELEEAKQLVQDAITSGIFCDLGSGSSVDLCVISEAGGEFLRGYHKPTTRGKREGQYRYKPGTTAVLTKTVTPLSLDMLHQSVQAMSSE